jgi:putative DNA methylase
MALVDHVNWMRLDRQVIQQQRNRSAYVPAISFYRWWARRPHCFAGAILDAAKQEFGLKKFLVADPFSGGGTVAFEAVRRRLPIYAQDLYPWPSKGLAAALTPTDADEFKAVAKILLETLTPLRRRYFREDHGDVWETTHIIRVRTAACPECSKRLFLFREPLISLASRAAEEPDAFFGCYGCGTVSRRRKDTHFFFCDGCHSRISVRGDKATSRLTEVSCPHCSFKSVPFGEILRSTLEWHPVLLREQCLSRKKTSSNLRTIASEDQVGDSREVENTVLHSEIPVGLETSALVRWGFSTWDQLYSQRQLDIITSALDSVSTLSASETVKDHLQLAILGATEMAGYVCRWERYHPKALEAIANHRFSRSTVTVETNLLSNTGRGTLPRRFDAAEKALRWMQKEGYPAKTAQLESSAPRRVVSGALVVTGSSERQLLKNGAARLAFTDPPYHDDLQYGELARLFHAWMNYTGAFSEPTECDEAVTNSPRGMTTQHYEDKVAACLAESRRALSSKGRLVLTFHNKNLSAWQALARALVRAGFDVVGLATVAAENSADHSKRGKRSFLSDLVIECRPKRLKRRRPWNLIVHGVSGKAERRNLEAVGLALSQCVNQGEGDLDALFHQHMRRLKAKQTLIHRGGRVAWRGLMPSDC